MSFSFQAIRLKYLQPDTELEKYIFQVMEMLRADSLFDAQALVYSSFYSAKISSNCAFYFG